MKKKITLIISLIVGVAILSIASYYISIYNEENKESTYRFHHRNLLNKTDNRQKNLSYLYISLNLQLQR